MATDTITIQPKTRTGTQVIWAGSGSTLITNLDLVNTIYLGDNDAIKPGDPSGVVPLGPNGSVAVDGKSDLFAVNGNTTPVTVATLNGGVANFLGLTQGGGTLAIPSVQSPNFVTGVSGWQILQNGNAQFNNLTIRGTFLGLDFIINSLGIFIYSGVPALGNLVGSWTPAAGANDGLGNAFQKDLTVYNPGTTAYINVSSNGAAGANTGILFKAPGTTHVNANVPTQVSGRATNAGAANEVEILQLTSGQSSSLFSADISLFSESADATIPAQIQQTLAGVLISTLLPTVWNIGVPISCTFGTPSNSTLLLTDSWHGVTLDAGWTNLGPNFSYRLGVENRVFICGALQFNANIANTNINGANPIPVRYRPTETMFLPGGAGSAGCSIQPNGVIVAGSAALVTVFCNIDGSYPLDL